MKQPSNFERMMKVIDEVFATRTDPDQLQVTPAQREKLQRIHPATMSELSDENGPLIWLLLIPTTKIVMEDFLAARITEGELLERTKPGEEYDAIYLCSVTALPEIRRKGVTKQLCEDAIRSICKDHPVTTLFAWPFTPEGNGLAAKVAQDLKMELRLRP